jgi:glycosyltransferase involved in cell wall biosynthesis
MKVCFISGSYPPVPCGIGDYVQRLAQTLVTLGAEVHVITSAGRGIDQSDGSVHVWPVVEEWNLRSLSVVGDKVRRIGPDIANIQYPTQCYGRRMAVNLLPAYLRSMLHVPVLTTVHEYVTFHLLGRLRIALSALGSTAVILPDPENLDLLARRLPCRRSRFHHVPLGANIVSELPVGYDRQAQRASLGARPEDIVVAYFGFISPSKGLEALVEAMGIALSSRPQPPLRLLLVASKEPTDPSYADYHRRVRELVDSAIPAERVYWTGYASAEKVSAWLASADMAVFPFVDGASPRRTTLLAALGHGLPVISTMGTGATWSGLAAKQGVLLVPPMKPEALRQAITLLAADVGSRDRLAANARSFSSTLDWTGIALRTLAVYRELIGE